MWWGYDQLVDYFFIVVGFVLCVFISFLIVVVCEVVFYDGEVVWYEIVVMLVMCFGFFDFGIWFCFCFLLDFSEF